MPSKKQIDNNRNITDFVPVLGGIYFHGILYDEATRGSWWGSEANNNVTRYMLDYNANNLYIGNSRRSGGFYIRCVSEEKTVTDLTYLQDMTGEIADNTLDGTTASLITRWLPRTDHLRPRHLRH